MMLRMAGLFVCGVAAVGSLGARPAAACTPGDEACPVVLRMKPGATVIEAAGFVSEKRPHFYFKFDGKAGQTIVVHTDGGGLKTGAGIPITFPNGAGDALDEGAPFKLPATGAYVLDLLANLMSEGPFGRFRLTLKIN
jgi:hypothetical protein